MFRIIILFAFVCSCTFSFAQLPLDSFYKQGTSWIEVNTGSNAPTGHSGTLDTSGMRLTVGTDTTIAGIGYKTVHIKKIGSYGFQYDNWAQTINYYSSSVNGTSYYLGRLRIHGDTVFFTNDVMAAIGTTFDNTFPKFVEKVLYNANWIVGDTIKGNTVVTTIDSVTIQGQQLKRFSLSDGAHIIHGIGHNGGMLFGTSDNILYGSDAHKGICYTNAPWFDYHYNNQWLLKNNLNQTCFTGVGLAVNDAMNTDAFHIYPNPITGNIVHIDIPANAAIGSVTITDQLGKTTLVTEQEIKNRAIHFDRSPGVYFIRFVLKDGTSSVQKLLKL